MGNRPRKIGFGGVFPHPAAPIRQTERIFSRISITCTHRVVNVLFTIFFTRETYRTSTQKEIVTKKRQVETCRFLEVC